MEPDYIIEWQRTDARPVSKIITRDWRKVQEEVAGLQRNPKVLPESIRVFEDDGYTRKQVV